MRTLATLVAGALVLPACANDAKSLNALCAGMTAAAKARENLSDAYERELKAMEAGRLSGRLRSHFEMMASVNPGDHVTLLKGYAKEHGFSFECPGWEFRLGPPRSPRIAATQKRISGLAVHAGALYWIEGGALMRSGLGGANPKVLHSVEPKGEDSLGNGDLVRLQVVGDTLYWIAGERVWRMNTADGKPEALLTTTYANELHVDGNALFVTDQPRVVRIALDTGKAEVVADGEGRTTFVYSGGGYVWWETTREPDWRNLLRRKKLGDPSAPITIEELFQPDGFVRVEGGFWVNDRTLRPYLADAPPRGGAFDTDDWGTGNPSSMVIAPDGAFGLFHGDGQGWPNTGVLAKLTLARASPPAPIDVGFAGPHHLVLADGWLYWADATMGLYRAKVP